jgi:hypothetical protein
MFSRSLRQLVGPAFAIGGFLWVVLYGVVIIIGLQTGKLVSALDPAHTPILAHIGIWILPVSILVLGVGQVGVFARLQRRGRGLGITSVVFTALGMLMAFIGAIALSGISSSLANLSATMAGLGAMSTTVGAAFLGGAVWRARILSHWMVWTFMLIGIVTIPVLFATPLPFGPDWASDFLAFLLSGIAYALLGFRLMTTHTAEAEQAMSPSAHAATLAK